MPDSKNSTSKLGEGTYPTDERFTLAEVPGLRVRQLSLAAGQCVPWHNHSEITDTFFCMRGPAQNPGPRSYIRSRAWCGETVAIPPRRRHFVDAVNQQSCQFIAIQGVGTYNYVPVGD